MWSTTQVFNSPPAYIMALLLLYKWTDSDSDPVGSACDQIVCTCGMSLSITTHWHHLWAPYLSTMAEVGPSNPLIRNPHGHNQHKDCHEPCHLPMCIIMTDSWTATPGDDNVDEYLQEYQHCGITGQKVISQLLLKEKSIQMRYVKICWLKIIIINSAH